ncbi:MAG: hypothetical protein KC996_00765 [Phycisphaerales bacterium]|nr:hypothetical protein [Phycisphaerales bacterium]
MRPLVEPTIERMIDEDTPGCVSSFFPRRAGVVVLLGENDAVVLISAAGDVRAFLADRLDDIGEHGGRRADLRPVTRRVLMYFCGIGLETRWLLGRIAMRLDGALFGELLKRSSVQLLVFDDEPMRWRVLESLEIRGTIGRWIGPIPKESVARRVGEVIDEVFSLCRYPKELALAPKGTACAYREMGKCPAACDGSETLDSYRARFDEAWALIRPGLAAARESSERAMGEASAGLDFEAAGRHKRSAELLGGIPAHETRLTRELAGMRAMVVSPCAMRSWAGVWVFGEGGLTMLGCVREDSGRVVVAGLIERAMTIGALETFDERSVHDLGLVTGVAHAKPGRGHRRVPSVFDLLGSIQIGAVQRAIVHASQPVEQDTSPGAP